MNWTDEDIAAMDEAMAAVAGELGGPKYDGEDPNAFMEDLQQWMKDEPDQFLPYCEKSRERILSFLPKYGLSSTAELPKSVRYVLDEHCQTLVGGTMKKALDSINGSDLRLKSPAWQVLTLEKAKIDLDAAVEYLADVNPRERKKWMKSIDPLRRQCERTARVLRARM